MRVLYGLIIMLGFLGCNKEDENNTKLELTVLDYQGKPAYGISVKLFDIWDYYRENVSELKKGITNSKGIVTFTNLDTINYYFSAIDGCSNNFLDIRSAVMKEELTTAITIRMQQTANISITNNSNNDYEIYFNGYSRFLTFSHSSSLKKNSMPTGDVNVRVLEFRSKSMFPSDTTYIIKAECNSNESIVIQ
ncbi:MAG: hypothetical protein IPQ02_12730 [Saprospiraceae bacterium]|nr:hypothetical protein [Candidatus Defluviibacterium haderslevense]